jgi:hypothetical protein
MTTATISASTVFKDLALHIRLPCLVILWVAGYNTHLYWESGQAWQQNARFSTTKGKLTKLQRLKYSYVAVPRYAVEYEYEVDGVKYTSSRATTGSPYRDWMGNWYNDTITEAQYLQSVPLLRVGERCTVLYDRKHPGSHSAIAHDANSWEISLMLYVAVFPILMAPLMQLQYHNWVIARRARRLRFKMPTWANPNVKQGPPPK